jgi:hypothetical protein
MDGSNALSVNFACFRCGAVSEIRPKGKDGWVDSRETNHSPSPQPAPAFHPEPEKPPVQTTLPATPLPKKLPAGKPGQATTKLRWATDRKTNEKFQEASKIWGEVGHEPKWIRIYRHLTEIDEVFGQNLLVIIIFEYQTTPTEMALRWTGIDLVGFVYPGLLMMRRKDQDKLDEMRECVAKNCGYTVDQLNSPHFLRTIWKYRNKAPSIIPQEKHKVPTGTRSSYSRWRVSEPDWMVGDYRLYDSNGNNIFVGTPYYWTKD